MRILFLHQNFPGQFRHLAQALAAHPGHQVVALCQAQAPGLPGLTGLTLIRYQPKRSPHASTHPYLRGMENAVLAGQAVAQVLVRCKQGGFSPDIVIAHPGWGEALYVKEVYPDARVIHFCEWYYHPEGADAGFDPAEPLTLDQRARIRSRNALHLLNLENCDVGVTPTAWQMAQHPAIYHPKLRVIHEGIDTTQARPDPNATFTLPNGRTLTAQDTVITYVARNLEPYRGFPQFMHALARLQAEHPDVQALIVGGDEVSYGSKPKDAPNWREKLLREVTIDPARTHFLGKLPYTRYLQALQISSAHVYLTYPFVLSWSLLEAMAVGCCIVASDTPPVREVLQDGVHGHWVDFFDTDALVQGLQAVLKHPDPQQPLRCAAQAHARQHYSVQQGLEGWMSLIQQVTSGTALPSQSPGSLEMRVPFAFSGITPADLTPAPLTDAGPSAADIAPAKRLTPGLLS